ncbi:MAG: 16S rRNA (uracil(1498)-N(3))-methyltransferase [Bacteroidia bacterium]
MSQSLFFHSDLSNSSIVLPEEESKHLVRVLRKQKGDLIQLIDGKGHMAIARIEEDHPKKTQLLLIEIQEKVRSRNYHIELAIAPTKNMDRIEWMLEKCCEIGLDAIHFIHCDNSERSKINQERLEKICISAIKQSKQFHLPEIHALIDFKSFISKYKSGDMSKYIAWCESEQSSFLAQDLAKNSPERILFLIGPEGDFSPAEIQLAKTNGFKDVSLGKNILRTETAGLFVCSLAAGFAKSNSHY